MTATTRIRFIQSNWKDTQIALLSFFRNSQWSTMLIIDNLLSALAKYLKLLKREVKKLQTFRS